MTTIINIEKVNNIIFFNPKILQENEYKQRKYDLLLRETDNLTIYPLAENTMKKTTSTFNKFSNDLYKNIRASGKFCDGIMAGYVKDSLKDCDFILCIQSSQTRSKKINGFATLKIFRNSKSLYVDVICTNSDVKGTGSYMIKLLSKICNIIGLDHIKLSSATQALPFYLKTDFECNPLCKMIKNVGGSKTRKNKINSKSYNFTKTRRQY